MSLNLVSAVISGMAALAVAALTYLLTKQKERDTDRRKVKLELYREYIATVAGIVEGRMKPESEVRCHDAFNTIGLVVSSAILTAVQAFRAKISPANTAQTWASHNEKYTNMVKALRQNLASGRLHGKNVLSFYMISTRPSPGSIAPTSK